jgi:hypothetical protein
MPEKFATVLVSPVYLRDSLLIDMTADETTRRDVGFTRSDQIGKVFLVVGQDVRKCLVCEELFTRRTAFKHSTVLCMPGNVQKL